MSYRDGSIYVHTEEQFPKKDHWVILKFKSWYVEGDERSRTNPGHGYPGHTETGVDYIAFEKEEDWAKEVISLTENKRGYSKESFVAFKASKPVSTKTTISIEK